MHVYVYHRRILYTIHLQLRLQVHTHVYTVHHHTPSDSLMPVGPQASILLQKKTEQDPAFLTLAPYPEVGAWLHTEYFGVQLHTEYVGLQLPYKCITTKKNRARPSFFDPNPLS